MIKNSNEQEIFFALPTYSELETKIYGTALRQIIVDKEQNIITLKLFDLQLQMNLTSDNYTALVSIANRKSRAWIEELKRPFVIEGSEEHSFGKQLAKCLNRIDNGDKNTNSKTKTKANTTHKILN